ncbi:MAG: cobalamin-binding protein [Alphaproteobacteria bacterium]
MAEPRVISLIASATEIVCALGLAGRLVGRSHECDFPDEVRGVAVVTEPKFSTQGTSAEIDRRVKDLFARALSVYRVDALRLKALRPDVIVTQSQCELCAVSLAEVERAVADWLEARPRIVSLEPTGLADLWTDIARVAEVLGVPERGAALVESLQARMAAIAERAGGLAGRPSVASIEWIDPLMAAGNWMPELVEKAGGVSLFGEAGKHSPGMRWEDLRSAEPDIIVVLPCGFDMARTRAEMPALTGRPGWRALRAVRAGRVFLTDGNQYFNRPGPRLVESLEILAEILHPEAFHLGHEGTGWERL